MSLNDSMTLNERSKLAVWDYPISDRFLILCLYMQFLLYTFPFSYTKMWQAMQEAGLPETLEEAVERVQISRSSSEGFAFLGKFKLSFSRNVL
jgi:glutamate receptor, ionotropic, invertebrate